MTQSLRRSFGLLAASVSLIALSACGGGGSAIPAVSPTSTLPPVATPPPPPPLDVEAIWVNQTGFTPNSRKTAIVSSAESAPMDWVVRDSTGLNVANGQTTVFGRSVQAEADLHHIDFSNLVTAGTGYTLNIEDVNSAPFTVDEEVYAPLAKDALAYFYHNRAGEEILTRYVGDEFAREAGHSLEQVSCFSGFDDFGTLWPDQSNTGCDYTLDVKGGWYDAGDHGKYIVNSGFAVWNLLASYERAPDQLPDNSLAMPQSGNGVSDLLDEARKNLDFMLSMQVPDGKTQSVPVGLQDPATLTLTDVDVSGMVHAKVHGNVWQVFGTAPKDNDIPRALYYPTTAATLHVAAIGAQCARIWAAIDPDYSAQCLIAARKAYAAAQANPEIYAYANFDGGGPYDDEYLADEFYWAATELFITTGERDFREDMNAARTEVISTGNFSVLIEPISPNVRMLGTMSMARMGTGADSTLAQDDLKSAADNLIRQTEFEGMSMPYEQVETYWGSNGSLMSRAVLFGAMYDVSGDSDYRNAAVDLMDYVLGRNPLDVSYVSGYGERFMENPHHTYWTKTLDPTRPGPPPGVMSGGPNDSAAVDPIAIEIAGSCEAQTCWRDDDRAYSLNEVAINWNSSLAAAAAFLDDTAGD